MFRRMVSRLVLALTLASLLALTGPTRAEAAGFARPRPVWDWLASLWEEGISALWAGSETAMDKEGYGIDPNGITTPGSSGLAPAPAPSTVQGDEGYGIDPNGTP